MEVLSRSVLREPVFRLPGVPTAPQLVDRAFRRARRATTRRGRTHPERKRNLAALQIRTAADVLESNLRDLVRAVPSLERLPPFPRELVDALVGVDALRKHLSALEWAADQVRRVASA